jgi:hypothetical protein
MRLRRTVSILASAALCGPGVPARSPAIFYVSPGGSDQASGTASHPLLSPQAAVGRLGRSGGTIVLAGGRYSGKRIVLDGRSHVTVRAAAGAAPVLDGPGL